MNQQAGKHKKKALPAGRDTGTNERACLWGVPQAGKKNRKRYRPVCEAEEQKGFRQGLTGCCDGWFPFGMRGELSSGQAGTGCSFLQEEFFQVIRFKPDHLYEVGNQVLIARRIDRIGIHMLCAFL